MLVCRYQNKFKLTIRGIKISLKGKINNSDRTRKYALSGGLINPQSFDSIVEFSQAESYSLSGVFTIRF